MSEEKKNDVFSMMKQYSEENNVDGDDIFGADEEPRAAVKEPEPETPAQEQAEATIKNDGLKKEEPASKTEEQPMGVPVSRPGQPDPVDEVPAEVRGGGVVLSTEEFNAGNKEGTMINGADEEIIANGNDQLNELETARINIDAAKEIIGVDKLQIPEMFNHELIGLAVDPNPSVHRDALVERMKQIIDEIPAVVISWLPGRGPEGAAANDDIMNEEVSTAAPAPQANEEVVPVVHKEPTEIEPTDTDKPTDVSVVIDKTNVSQVAFSEEEREKITKARTVKLNIVDEGSLKFNIVDEALDDVDKLMAYSRKFSDNAIALPASRYRATATGLSYPEMLDLSYSQEMNNLDGERKKWNIAYEHIKNASIGKFADEDDFLQKTSFIDLDYILWAILCATSMDQEIVSITCGNRECRSDYDWIYSPKSLLELDKIPEKTLEELKVTGEASTAEAISSNYNSSLLRQGNIVELPNSKFSVCFGHISAYTYLNVVFGLIEEIKENPTYHSRDVYGIPILSILKYMLVPNKDKTGYYKVTNYRTMLDIINGLDEVDFQVLGSLANDMTDPYLMSFAIKDTVCPKCHTRSSIPVAEISNLLFIIARSLSSVNVTFERPQNS